MVAFMGIWLFPKISSSTQDSRAIGSTIVLPALIAGFASSASIRAWQSDSFRYTTDISTGLFPEGRQPLHQFVGMCISVGIAVGSGGLGGALIKAMSGTAIRKQFQPFIEEAWDGLPVDYSP